MPLLARDQIESLYRGDWLARKIVDIVPYDCVREWRTWAGDPADVARIEGVERALNLRRAVQRAMVSGRLYGGGALIVGTTETDPEALMTELRPMDVGRNGIAFLHAVSRWQLGVAEIASRATHRGGGRKVVDHRRGNRLYPSRNVGQKYVVKLRVLLIQ